MSISRGFTSAYDDLSNMEVTSNMEMTSNIVKIMNDVLTGEVSLPTRNYSTRTAINGTAYLFIYLRFIYI